MQVDQHAVAIGSWHFQRGDDVRGHTRSSSFFNIDRIMFLGIRGAKLLPRVRTFAPLGQSLLPTLGMIQGFQPLLRLGADGRGYRDYASQVRRAVGIEGGRVLLLRLSKYD